MRQASRRPAVLVLLALVASLLTVITTAGTANAADSVPTLQWPAVNVSQYADHTVTAPNGDVTVPCAASGSGSDLVTYNSSGQVVRQLDHTSYVDGVQNCMSNPAVDKNGTLYGVPSGSLSGGGWGFGPNLLAYSGNTLKWKYPAHCDNNTDPQVAVGGDGNIYVTTYGHLIGLAPDLAAGQTQPTKLVDVTIPTDCSIKLFPYKDGIMLHGQRSGNPLYYSYAGQALTQPSAGQFGTERVGADGQFFTYSTVTGSYNSISVSSWDPRSNPSVWTTSASTPGANTSGGPSLYAMEDGGVAALITEQKMVGGVPVSPTQWVQTVSVINAAGIKTRSFQLADTYSVGGVTGAYDGTLTITPDATGKLVFVRGLNLNTGLSWPNPSTVPAIYVGVYDPASGSMTYEQVMRGDLAKSNGPDGYQWNYGANSVSIAGNTVYLMAKCTNNCSDYNWKLYPIQVSGLGMDYPRGDVLGKSLRPTTYLALGDSFSSGEGNPPFLSGTDISGVNTCHRSSAAYPELISGTSSKIPYLGSYGFRACSGAVSNNVWNFPQWNEGIQLDWAPETYTQLVTMTMGGNDIGFSDFAQACVKSTCQVGTTAYNNSLNAINNTLPGALKTTYEHILTYAPNAQIYVMDYPQVVAAKSTSDADDPRCPYMYNNGTNATNSPYYPWEDDFAARDIVTKLDNQISTVIGQVRGENADYSARLHYVPVNGANSPFAGHAICDSGTSYFQNVDQAGNYTAYVFHPNTNGQAAYAQLMAAAINAG